MKTMELSWGKFLPRALVLGAIIAAGVFVAVHAAMAREGERGGHTRTFLTVAGSIAVPVRMPPMTPHLTFIFEKVDPLSDAGAAAGPSVVCTVTNASTQYNTSTGSFSSEIPIDACPGSMFDGANVWVTTVVRDGSMTGAELLRTERRPLNPVPYARYADQYGTPDCPVGYDLDPTSPGGRKYCRKPLAGGLYDEVVRVGSGATAFWIDRYETSVNYAPDASGSWLFTADADLTYFPRNGQWGRAVAGHAPYALSVVRTPGTPPARWITWFQALEVCANSGKELPTGVQWLRAASGTTDDASLCNISTTGPRNPGAGGGCGSSWGAQDMVGNLNEWTAEWFAGAGAITSPTLTLPDGGVVLAPPSSGTSLGGTRVNERVDQWPTGYNNDGTWNITSVVDRGDGTGEGAIMGLPAAAYRGGYWTGGPRAGVFSLGLSAAPSYSASSLGFRCVIPR
ncbi:MAG: hypothetical protein U0326_27285 [Polyangiales bacterium]